MSGRRARWLQPERLEERMMLAGNVNPWHNMADPLDVNDDTSLTPPGCFDSRQ